MVIMVATLGFLTQGFNPYYVKSCELGLKSVPSGTAMHARDLTGL